MRVLTPGALVSELLDSEPAIVVAAVEELAARWERPSRSITEILDLLARHPTMSEPIGRLRSLLA
jgi:hypothetical protein